MKVKQLLSVAALIVLSFAGNQAGAQGMAVNTSGAAANSSAMLDVSSTTQGMLVPRMITAQRTAISSPATGLLVYQTDGTAGFYFYNGTAWAAVSGGSTSSSVYFRTGCTVGSPTLYLNPNAANSTNTTQGFGVSGYSPVALTFDNIYVLFSDVSGGGKSINVTLQKIASSSVSTSTPTFSDVANVSFTSASGANAYTMPVSSATLLAGDLFVWKVTGGTAADQSHLQIVAIAH